MTTLLEQLTGSWVLVAAKTEFEDGTTADMYGPNPSGFGAFTRERRLMAVITTTSRSVGSDDATLAMLFRTMMAYSGRFTLDGNELTVTVDAAWMPDWVGTRQTRYVLLEGDTLYLRSATQMHPLYPGRQVVGALTWRREVPERSSN